MWPIPRPTSLRELTILQGHLAGLMWHVQCSIRSSCMHIQYREADSDDRDQGLAGASIAVKENIYLFLIAFNRSRYLTRFSGYGSRLGCSQTRYKSTARRICSIYLPIEREPSAFWRILLHFLTFMTIGEHLNTRRSSHACAVNVVHRGGR